MYCPRCGSKNSDLSNFCKSCGTGLNNKKVNTEKDVYDYSYEYSNVTDLDLQKAYIGLNYDKINNTTFSIPAFIFGSFYLIYRKMWLYGILLFISEVLILFFVQEYSIPLIIVISITMGINFKSIYFYYVDKEISKVKMKNQDKTNRELKKIFKKKGGKSEIGVVIFTLLLFITLVSTFIILIINGTIKSDIFNIENNDPKINSMGDLTYNLPQNYKITSSSTDSYKRYSLKDDFKYCSFSLEKINSDMTSEEYFNNKIYTTSEDKKSEITPIIINGIEWSYLTVENKYKVNYYYAISYDDNLYKVEYNITNNNKECVSSYESFLASLEFVKKDVPTI